MNGRRTSIAALNFIIYILIIFLAPIWVGAQEWSEPVRISNSQEGDFYPKIIANDNFIHVAYTDRVGAAVHYTRSSDYGQTWSGPINLNPSNHAIEYPELIYTGSLVMCLWNSMINSNNNICYRVSDNNGQDWSELQYVLDPAWQNHMHYTVSNKGPSVNLALVKDYVAGALYNVQSNDFGVTWSNPNLIADPLAIWGMCGQAQIGLDIHSVWAGNFEPVEPSLYYSHSTDGGLSWLEPVQLKDNEYWNQSPRVDVNQSGCVGVTWIQNGNVFLRKSLNSGESWDSIIQITTNNTARDYCNIGLKNDQIYLLWGDNRFRQGDRDAVFFKKSIDGGFSWDDEVWLDLDTSKSVSPCLAYSYNKIFACWWEAISPAESLSEAGIYFSCWPDFPDAIDEETPSLPSQLKLSAFPNPFNASTLITYNGATEDSAISIFDITGRLVRRLEISQESGSVVWDARDTKGNNLASGIYFAKYRDRQKQSSIKLLLIK